MAGTEHVINVEHILSKKVVRIDAGETSTTGGDDQSVIATEVAVTLSASVQETATSSRVEKFKKLREAGVDNMQNQAQPKSSKIQEIPFLLRDHKNFAKYYEPRVVSLGPIHHGKPKYQLAEGYKLRLANDFIKDSGTTEVDVYNMVEKNIKQLRKFFDEEVIKDYGDESLAWMLFVDGCAILQFIWSAVQDKFKDLKIKNDQVAFAQQDLFLLENQLPYQLLEDLMKLSTKKDDLKNAITSFINSNNLVPAESSTKPKEAPTETNPIHLLDLLRTSLLGNDPVPDDSTSKKNQKKKKKNQDNEWQSYRNVQELRVAGIFLRPSTNSCLRNISFTKTVYAGYLKLPPIVVDDSTRPKFLNLIAFEMCPDFVNDFGVTSYIYFLDSLIDQASDVIELRKAKILRNFLGSDEEVAQLFNEIGTDLVPNSDTYKNVKVKIQEYYSNQWMTWIAEFIHNHFRSPWTFLAFLGALLALGLSAAQTWYTVNSSSSSSTDALSNTTRY